MGKRSKFIEVPILTGNECPTSVRLFLSGHLLSGSKRLGHAAARTVGACPTEQAVALRFALPLQRNNDVRVGTRSEAPRSRHRISRRAPYLGTEPRVTPSLMMPGIIISFIFSEHGRLVFCTSPSQNQLTGVPQPVDDATHWFSIQVDTANLPRRRGVTCSRSSSPASTRRSMLRWLTRHIRAASFRLTRSGSGNARICPAIEWFLRAVATRI
jgi:hypothetical protein